MTSRGAPPANVRILRRPAPAPTVVPLPPPSTQQVAPAPTLPTVPTPIQPPRIARDPILPPARPSATNVVVHASAAAPPPPTPILPGGFAGKNQEATTTTDQLIRTQFKQFETQWNARWDARTDMFEAKMKEWMQAAIRDLKGQFQSMEVMGETLSDGIPIFSRPDSTLTPDTRVPLRGTKLRLFQPILPNQYGYWMQTLYVTQQGTSISGYVPIFSVKLEGVNYAMSDDELKQRMEQWSGYLDQLSDKNFVPNVGRFSV